MNKVEPTVLTPKQLAERWQISLTKIYEDNSAGKLPQLPGNRNRFPINAIEEMEQEASFDKNNIKTPRERRMERELQEKESILEQKDKEIATLKTRINAMISIGAEVIYTNDV